MRPEGVVFFLDRSIGKRTVATALSSVGAVVELHDDHFPPDAADPEWIHAVGQRGWVVLTKDQRIRYRPLEIAAVRAARARLFVITAGNLTGQGMADLVVRHRPRIERLAVAGPGPFIYRVTRTGVSRVPI